MVASQGVEPRTLWSSAKRSAFQANALPPELGSHLWRFVKQSYDLGQEEFLRELLIITE